MSYLILILIYVSIGNTFDKLPDWVQEDDSCATFSQFETSRQREIETDEDLLSSEIRDEINLIVPENSMVHSQSSPPIDWRDFNVKTFLAKGALKEGEDPFEANQFNQTASDAIHYDRQLPDFRDSKCLDLRWDRRNLPTVSIIIIYHNEARSTLLRTLLSIFNRTPPELILEIIIVDDFSNDESIGQDLAVIDKVKVLRNMQREGLIRARMRGASLARAPVLTFFDSHCECTHNWLEPLLARIVENNKALVSPIIDSINYETFEYQAANDGIRGGFTWNLVFKWDFMKEKAYKEWLNDNTAPIRTPMILGGEFSIARRWYEKVGTYDEEMFIWGAEHLEQAMRIWMCGGSLEIIPCSRVGHVFRKKFPYTFPGGDKVVQRNTRRVAEVWMGKYKHLYYRHSPESKTVEFGDISKRLELKAQLQCREFDWYLENVYPELKVPVVRPGQIVEIKYDDFCLDSMWHHEPGGQPDLYQCHASGNNQAWIFNVETGQLMESALYHCLVIDNYGKIVFDLCDKVKTKWTLSIGTGQIRQGNSCLTVEHKSDLDQFVLHALRCDPADTRQTWQISKQEIDDLEYFRP